MKLSDLQGALEAREEEEPLPYPRSLFADPPISPVEARAAETAICCRHNGRIKTDPLQTDVVGRVYFCPIGREYWRYSKGDGGLKLAPLRYPKVSV